MQYKSIKELFTAIADKLRAKEGWIGNIPSQDIPMAIDLACQQQYANGWNEGESEGRQSGYENGFKVGYNEGERNGTQSGYESGYTEGEIVGREQGKEQGKAEVYSEIEPINAQLENTLNGTDTGGKSYYDEFWDSFQNYGILNDFGSFFAGNGWNDITFKPKYNLKPSLAHSMFNACKITDLEAALEKSNITLDTSNCSRCDSMFAYTLYLTVVPEINASKCNAFRSHNMFLNAIALHTIRKLIVSADTEFTNAFNECYALENLTIEGTIGRDGFNVQWSTKLSKASIISIINALSTTASGKSVTLSKVAVESAFGSTASEEWISLINARSNWTINLV